MGTTAHATEEAEPEVIDSTAEEEGTDDPMNDATEAPLPVATTVHSTAHPSTALVPRTITNEVIRPLAPADVKAAMVEHQELLRQILDPSDWQGRPDAQGSFVKKSGWRKVALAYNLAVRKVDETVERDDDGKPLRASVTVEATAPNGRSMEASGHCSFDESRFSGARGNTSKLENDMRGTAETRAKNRAISDLIGMGKVSAEEVEAGAGHLPYGEDASAQVVSKFSNALMFLFDGDQDAAAAAFAKVKDACDGHVPKVVAAAITLTVAAYRDFEDNDPSGDDSVAATDEPTAEGGDE